MEDPPDATLDAASKNILENMRMCICKICYNESISQEDYLHRVDCIRDSIRDGSTLRSLRYRSNDPRGFYAARFGGSNAGFKTWTWQGSKHIRKLKDSSKPLSELQSYITEAGKFIFPTKNVLLVKQMAGLHAGLSLKLSDLTKMPTIADILKRVDKVFLIPGAIIPIEPESNFSGSPECSAGGGHEDREVQ